MISITLNVGSLSFPLSFTQIDMMEVCGRRYAHSYVSRLEKVVQSIHLGAGKAMDELTSNYLRAAALGQSYDIERQFDVVWAQLIDPFTWDYGNKWSPDRMKETCFALARQFPQAYRHSGIIPWIATDGKPAVQWDYVFPIYPGVYVRVLIDLVGFHVDTEQPCIIDIKLCADPAPAYLAPQSLQLLLYALGAEADPRLGLDAPIQFAGFWDMEKKFVPQKGNGLGPQIHVPDLSLLLPTDKAEVVPRVLAILRRIRAGEFYKHTGQAFNTPCAMCDFTTLCSSGDTAGLRQKQRRPQKTV